MSRTHEKLLIATLAGLVIAAAAAFAISPAVAAGSADRAELAVAAHLTVLDARYLDLAKGYAAAHH
jgi:hypothetical protein